MQSTLGKVPIAEPGPIMARIPVNLIRCTAELGLEARWFCFWLSLKGAFFFLQVESMENVESDRVRVRNIKIIILNGL